jgi:fatty-acyl-CoA synthase
VFEVMYACALVDAVVVPLNWRLTEAELAAVGADAEPAVLVHESWAHDVAVRVGTQPKIPTTVGWAQRERDPDDYERLATAAVSASWTPRAVDEDGVWTIIYTSGTTGVPKGVQATHRGCARQHARHPGRARRHRLVTLPDRAADLPRRGLNLHANPALYAGGTVVVARTFDPAMTLRLITDAQTPVTHFCGVPANYQFMQQLPEFADAPLRPFLAAVGGSPVPSALVSAWANRGVALTTVFGITEAGACVTTMPPGRERDHNGTIGLPVLYARCRVRTADDRTVGPGETGELQISGPLVTPGYWRKPDAIRDTFTADGWLRTGDAASRTEDGSWSWSTGGRTCTSPAARTSTPPRSRTSCSPIPRWPRRPSSGPRIRGGASPASRS